MARTHIRTSIIHLDVQHTYDNRILFHLIFLTAISQPRMLQIIIMEVSRAFFPNFFLFTFCCKQVLLHFGTFYNFNTHPFDCSMYYFVGLISDIQNRSGWMWRSKGRYLVEIQHKLRSIIFNAIIFCERVCVSECDTIIITCEWSVSNIFIYISTYSKHNNIQTFRSKMMRNRKYSK